MPEIKQISIVPFTQSQMYDLVNDVAEYPNFLPGCSKVDILNKSQEQIEATVHIAKGSISQSFTTLNKLSKPEYIKMRLVAGPFKHLEGIWKFEPLGDKTKVSLSMNFEFANKLLSMAVGPIFSNMAQSMVQAFAKRAHEVFASVNQIPVEIVFASKTEQKIINITVPEKTSIEQAIHISKITNNFPEINLSGENANKVGVFGKIVNLDAWVNPKDRIEIYRPLEKSAIEARILRAKQQKNKNNNAN